MSQNIFVPNGETTIQLTEKEYLTAIRNAHFTTQNRRDSYLKMYPKIDDTRRTLKDGKIDKRVKRKVLEHKPKNTMKKQCYLCHQNTMLHIHSTSRDFAEITGLPTYFLVPKKVYVYDDNNEKILDDNDKPIRKEIKVRKYFVVCVECWQKAKGTKIVFNYIH